MAKPKVKQASPDGVSDGDVKVEVVPLTDLQPDPGNANKGTERGYMMLTDSLQKRGVARGIFATADGVVMAGNKTQQAALDSGIDKAILVHTRGDALVVTVRDDLQSSDPQAKVLAIEDNRVGQVDLEWDAAALLRLADETPEVVEELGDDWRALLRDVGLSEPELVFPTDGSGPPGMELLPDEKYDYVLMAFTKQQDFERACNVLGLEHRRDPRSGWAQHVGLCRVIDGNVVITKLVDDGDRDTESAEGR